MINVIIVLGGALTTGLQVAEQLRTITEAPVIILQDKNPSKRSVENMPYAPEIPALKVIAAENENDTLEATGSASISPNYIMQLIKQPEMEYSNDTLRYPVGFV